MDYFIRGQLIFKHGGPNVKGCKYQPLGKLIFCFLLHGYGLWPQPYKVSFTLIKGSP